ncbi:GIY-YIG nuclease family protein [Thiomicrorhabdus xiamenensis]|uniref:GIY-YIG nuclease family protein n=1 Tax=Thiomicrorhabdus xiamenensis TaxID=2739063 RepID=A0A7D4SJB2_9GAMM|nr:GIY-YIG nuclease family protein [Thiomicrorhabdus xiamenensis]QKI89759.1 GIY-YIG nuclease family protein [Thiomicrorhabdus xiamenensis]
MKQGFVYIMTNQKNGTLYIGVTSNLVQRVHQHKNHLVEGFTKRYGLDNLVYYEQFADIRTAIEREKQLKAGSRKKKIQLIELINPEWNDLYESIL